MSDEIKKQVMSKARYFHMMNPETEESLTEVEIKSGYHYCHDFDGLLRTNWGDEYECSCNSEAK